MLSERQQDLQRVNTSLQQDLTTLREKMHKMSEQLKENDNTEKILEQEIVTLTNKLSSANAKLKEMFPAAKAEIKAALDKSTGTNLVKPTQLECNTCTRTSINIKTFNLLNYVRE